MDHLPQSDNLSDLSEVVAETFGDDADKFIDEYVRQKERHKELFENLFKKYEGMKESGLEFRLSDIPDPRIVEKKKSKSIKKKSCSIKKAKMESESDSIRDVLEIQDISAACSNSDMLAWQYFFEQQLKRFEAFMQQQLIAIYEFQQFKSEIEEKQAKERYKESRRKQMPFKRESFTTQLVKKKSKSANITEVAKISDLSTAGFNSAQKKNKPASISKGHETSNLSVANINSVKRKSKSVNITEAVETPDLSTVEFNSAQKKNKPASISKGHETSDLSVANINSVKRKSKSANITEAVETPDLSTAGFNSAQKKRKPASISKVHETSELSLASINSVKRKSKSVNVTQMAETPDLSTAEFNSAQKKKKPASIRKLHETSELSIASIISELNMGTENWNEEHPVGIEYDNEGVKETRSKEESLMPSVVLEDNRKIQITKKSKSANITEVAEISDLSTAGFNSSQKKNKPPSISKGHETPDLSVANINSVIRKSKSPNVTEAVETPDLSTAEFNSAQKKNKPASISKGHETSDLSVANINSAKRKSKSANITEAVETPDLYTAEFNSAQKKRKPASISKVHETSELSVANINSGLNMGTENWNEENPVGIENDNEVVKETRSKEWSLMPSVVLEDNRKIQIKKGKFAHVTQVAETPDLSTAEFNSAQKKRKPASISKVHETSELSVANINSELNMGTENWNEEHPVGIEYDNEVVKETRSKEGSLMPSVVLEDNRKFQITKKSKSANITEVAEISDLSTAGFNSSQKKNKPPSISKGHETPDLSVANINSVKRKSKSGNITEAVETPNLSTAEFNSAQKKNKSASISKGHETSDLSVANINSVKRKSKSANITEAVETPDLSTAGFNSAQKKRKPASISKVHETSEVSVASINSELNVDNSSRKEDVLDNQSLKKSRFKKGCVPSADHITKSSSRKSVFSNADESFKCVNNVDKVSVNALAKSWKPSNRFKKHLWYGIVPVCSLTRSPQTSSRSILDFSLVSAMPPVPRPLSPLSPETR